jgi:hypothetical protein
VWADRFPFSYPLLLCYTCRLQEARRLKENWTIQAIDLVRELLAATKFSIIRFVNKKNEQNGICYLRFVRLSYIEFVYPRVFGVTNG